MYDHTLFMIRLLCPIANDSVVAQWGSSFKIKTPQRKISKSLAGNHWYTQSECQNLLVLDSSTGKKKISFLESLKCCLWCTQLINIGYNWLPKSASPQFCTHGSSEAIGNNSTCSWIQHTGSHRIWTYYLIDLKACTTTCFILWHNLQTVIYYSKPMQDTPHVKVMIDAISIILSPH